MAYICTVTSLQHFKLRLEFVSLVFNWLLVILFKGNCIVSALQALLVLFIYCMLLVICTVSFERINDNDDET